MTIRRNGYGYECVYRDGEAISSEIYESHCHPFYEIIMVVRGEVLINIENRSFSARPGALVVIKPGAYHSVVMTTALEYRRITLLFEEFFIPKGIKNRFLEKARCDFLCYHDDGIHLLSRLQRALEGQNDADEYRELVEALIVEIFYTLTSADSYSEEGETDNGLQIMLDYIAEHITERITLEEIAGVAFLSKSAVCRIFKERMHTTFKQYLLQKKIAHAASLISRGVSANEAARIVGYDNYAGFYKMYRKFLSKSPTDRKGNPQE